MMVTPMRRVLALLAAVALAVGVAHPASADAIRDRQWYLEAMDITAAHQATMGQGVTVGVVDSGVDAGHPDLAGSVLEGTNVVTGSGDGHTDQTGHGTGMASLISGNADPNGVMGVAPEAKILPVRAGNGRYDPAAVAQGIRWAVDHGATVVNISIGGGGGGPDAREAVAYAQRHDVVVVASAGNIGSDGYKVGYPAAFPGVVAVACLGKDGKTVPEYTTGKKVELAAPCTEAVAAQPGGGYSTAGGTSNSAALVSGVAALVRAKYPNMDAANVVNRLITTAQDKGASGHDPKYGHGVVRPVQALTADVARVSKNPLGRVRVDNKPGGLAEGPDQSPGAAGPGDGGGSTPLGLIVALVVAGLVILAAAVAAIVLARRGGRNKQQPAPAGPPPGYGPPGSPPGPPGSPHGQPGPPPGGHSPPQGPR